MSERKLGYAIDNENMEVLWEQGVNTELMLELAADQYPVQDPYADPSPITPVKDQDGVGACQGFALSSIFGVCYFLATGQVANFSALGLYILSQKEDGLLGRDVGSTLSGGMRAAAKGICLDEDWPFSDRYDSRIPAVDRPYKLTGSKPTSDPELINAAIDSGNAVVQTGLSWNSELEQEVVTQYTGRGARGGHSTYLFGRKQNGNVIHHNSWGLWNADGKSEWTPQALKQAVTYRSNTFIIYTPELTFPPPPVIPI